MIAARDMPSPTTSVAMCAPSESNASEPVMTPAAISTIMKAAVRPESDEQRATVAPCCGDRAAVPVPVGWRAHGTSLVGGARVGGR